MDASRSPVFVAQARVHCGPLTIDLSFMLTNIFEKVDSPIDAAAGSP